MNKQYNELKEKIIEAVPEIMIPNEVFQQELDNKYQRYLCMCEKLITRKDKTGWEAEKLLKDVKDFSRSFNGRPITNDDIQITISKYLKNGDVLNSHINSRGELVLRTNNNLIDLKLGKPLQDQSDEVHNLLWELICKK